MPHIALAIRGSSGVRRIPGTASGGPVLRLTFPPPADWGMPLDQSMPLVLLVGEADNLSDLPINAEETALTCTLSKDKYTVSCALPFHWIPSPPPAAESSTR